MAKDANSIFVAAGGTVSVADVGADAPVDAITALSEDWVDAGHIARDPGVAITPNKTVKDVESWDDFSPVRQIVQSRELTVTIPFQQVDEQTLVMALDGGAVTGTTPDFEYTPPDPEEQLERALVVEGRDGAKIHRWYFPRVHVEQTAEIPFKRSDETVLVLTFKVLKPDSGDSFHPFFHDPDFAGAGGAPIGT